MPTVENEIKMFTGKHQKMMKSHENVDVISLLGNNELILQLKRLKPFELVL